MRRGETANALPCNLRQSRARVSALWTGLIYQNRAGVTDRMCVNDDRD